MCPFLNKSCLQSKCKLWIEAENDCAIPQIVYSLNLMKADYLSEIRQKSRDKK
jgi:hypothetical protein